MDRATFAGLIDLASQRWGGAALAVNDEFFAPRENLLEPASPVFIPGKYTEHGKWMDGWETRRRRSPGSDWCLIRLGLPGVIRAIDIDTSHFLGNYPPYASLEACESDEAASVDDLLEVPWQSLLRRSALQGGRSNLFVAASAGRCTHVRLTIFPDGGVARLRLLGRPMPHPDVFRTQEAIDLACLNHGGWPVACSDMFFSPMSNLIQPGPPSDMGDGWETCRRRGSGHDWIVVRLGRPGLIQQIVVDTAFFKGNAPGACDIEGALCGAEIDGLDCPSLDWKPVLARHALRPDQRHEFVDLEEAGPVDHVRLNIYPDGGVARLRILAVPVTEE